MTRVKICCITSREEAQLAIDHGAAALGLVSSCSRSAAAPGPCRSSTGATPPCLERCGKPFAVDVCNGVRENDKLSEHKLAQFMAAVARAG